GLVAFAGAPVLLCPLTTDAGFFRASLTDVDVGSAPRGGSMIGDAIRKGLTTLEERDDRDQVMLLITDGEDHESFPEQAAQQAAQRKIKLIAIGLGDVADGSRIPQPGDNSSGFLKYDGQDVVSKLDSTLLEKMALATGGAYIPAETRAYDLGDVYEQHLAPLTRGETSQSRQKRHRDRFPIFLFFGLVLLLCEPLTSSFSAEIRKPAAT
ncbi:MAG: VWA domain-containing protein, partial [Pirellulaceae bacterium]|nr:VWA domain-containing protein [Pirellulaceae bacterium]